MREAMKDRALRNIFYMGVAMAISVAVCVANIVIGNVYCIMASLVLVLLLAFALGYSFGVYEDEEKKRKNGENSIVKATAVEENEENRLY